MKIVLASASPRRKELLGTIFPEFEIVTPNTIETPLPFETPVAHAARLSFDKAHAVFAVTQNRYNTQLVIASDTIVVLNNEIFGKPKDYHDAFRMLSKLSGKTHTVYTALTLIYKNESRNEILTETEATDVTFNKLSENDIEQYLSMIEWSDKAGSYAVQLGGEFIIARIKGSYTNVIGFPLRRFFAMAVSLQVAQIVFNTSRKAETLMK